MNKVKAMLNERTKDTTIDKSELIRQVKSKIEEAVQAIFEENPTVNIIAVEGYTPHFNDGDVCRWGTNCQVDILGEVYHSELYEEMERIGLNNPNKIVGLEKLADTKYAKLLSRKPLSYRERDKIPNLENLEDAKKLLYSFKKEFEIWDNDSNGTVWMFVRRQNTNNFETIIDNFEHD